MRIRSLARPALVLALALALTPSGCSGSGTPRTTSGASGKPATAPIPAAFKTDDAKAVPLPISAEGGGAAVRTGDATMAVYVPKGAASAGATWRLLPLSTAPAGPKRALCPGVYVDTAGAKPAAGCSVGFALPGKAPANTVIVRIPDDGSSAEIVPTSRLERDGMTFLTAPVDGFSAYTTSEEDKAAADEAFVDRAKARGKQVDWTIKAGGTETQKVEGWTFTYELDFFASGGDEGVGGRYTGHSSLSLEGTYKGPVSIVKSFGTVSGIGRDQALSFYIVDAPLADLLTGKSVDTGIVAGQGTMKLDGMGSIDITAVAPNARGNVSKKNVKGSGGVPFTIVVKGEDVQIEIEKVGIFPGKILRTTK